jgi:hypothetical protein
MLQAHPSVDFRPLILAILPVSLVADAAYHRLAITLEGALMPADRSIKVIKREQRELLAGQDEGVGVQTERQLAREMSQAVSGWIEERRASSREGNRKANRVIVSSL